jgi:nitrite reductase/ring-hydroxylating ferredoxin subunit
MIRVAALSEIPPGKGMLISVGDRELCVYNLDGRFYATATRHARVAHGTTDTSHPHGALFDVYTEDSPARVRADQEQLPVRVEGDQIWVEAP